ncbi:MAG TPA: ATP-dependent zinc metalloprotease FtsH [Paludibacteraceae bacterium]|jgi:cell division protease FtsH|nr:ATP-dependent zinc metalloprotease FtsH [Paludibacteraceae bacterium]
MENKNPTPKPLKTGGKPSKFNFTWIYALIMIGLLASYLIGNDTPSKQVNVTQYEQYLNKGYIEKVYIYSNNTLQAFIIKDSASYVFGKDSTYNKKAPAISLLIGSPEEAKKTIDNASKTLGREIQVEYKTNKDYLNLILWGFGPIILMVFLFWMMNRRMGGMGGGAGGGIFSVGKSKAQLFDKGDGQNKITFKDVAGLQGAKQEVEEIVEFLKQPTKYTELGGKIPKGALLVGPPGTGKTLLAKAVAGEADVPFFSMSGSDFVEMFVGVGASRVRDLFRQAKEKAPCIIFIDEIDAVGRARGKNPNMGSNDERESTLNQLLTEMDGFGSNSGVIILAATNRADILDKALLRAGRFDRQIHVDLPDVHERKEIFNVHLRPIKIDNTVDVDFLARQTPGFSGADIANVCNEAALIAARKAKSFVGKQDFLDAVDRIIGGLEKKNKITTVEEKKSIAYHEAGHATISWKLRYANPLVKVTIVPRGEALGAAWYLPEERQLTNREHMLDEMCATLGGRAAEEVFLTQTSTGAINDLERVTKRAYAMVAYYGMSEKLPNMSYYDSTGNSDYGFTKPYSEKTAETIDEEARLIVAEQYERAKQILKENAAGHNTLAEILLDQEVIFAEDVERIFGKRPWESRSDELMRLNEDANALREKAKEAEQKAELPSSDETDGGEEKTGTADTNQEKNEQ